MEKLALTASPRDSQTADDGGRVVNEMNQLNQRYMRLMTELHQRLTHIKKVYDDVGIYFPVSCSSHSSTAAITAAAVRCVKYNINIDL